MKVDQGESADRMFYSINIPSSWHGMVTGNNERNREQSSAHSQFIIK